MRPEEHRPAAVAGSFYPRSREDLSATVDHLLAEAPRSPGTGAPKALIVPHAGYRYSGPVAATAFATLLTLPRRIERVVLLGPAHRVYVPTIARSPARVFETPLGHVAVECGALAQVVESAEAHAKEHSLEVELPFLQRALGEFALVPLLVGDAPTSEVAVVLSEAWGGEETLVVVSSDLSHCRPYTEARAMDRATARRIVELDNAPLSGDEACGAAAVNGLLSVARARSMRARMLDLRSSGDTAGDGREVVGYGAFALYEEARDAESS